MLLALASGPSPQACQTSGGAALGGLVVSRRLPCPGGLSPQACKTSGNPRLQQHAFPPTLDAYVQQGQDLFGYEQHFANWRHAPTAYNVIMVRWGDARASGAKPTPASSRQTKGLPGARARALFRQISG